MSRTELGPGFGFISIKMVISLGGSCLGIRSVVKPRLDHRATKERGLERAKLVLTRLTWYRRHLLIPGSVDVTTGQEL